MVKRTRQNRVPDWPVYTASAHTGSARVGSSEVVVVRYCSELQFSSNQ
jgi:hypothetical protein